MIKVASTLKGKKKERFLHEQRQKADQHRNAAAISFFAGGAPGQVLGAASKNSLENDWGSAGTLKKRELRDLQRHLGTLDVPVRDLDDTHLQDLVGKRNAAYVPNIDDNLEKLEGLSRQRSKSIPHIPLGPGARRYSEAPSPIKDDLHKRRQSEMDRILYGPTRETSPANLRKKYPSGYVIIPGGEKGPADIMAHEMGHASPQTRINMRGRGWAIATSPAVMGLGAMAGGAVGGAIGVNDDDSVAATAVKGSLRGAAGGTIGAAPRLFEEGRASWRGYGALKKIKLSPERLAKARGSLLRAHLTYMAMPIATGMAMGGMSASLRARSRANKKVEEVSLGKTANEHCEDLWDEIEGGGQIQTRHLESAPRFADEPLDLAPLSPKLAFQLGSVRLPIPAHGPDFPEALGEMMKTAAAAAKHGVWWKNFKSNLKNTAETLLTGGEKVQDPKNAKQLLKDTTSMTSGQKAQLGALIGLGAVAAGTAWYASRRRAQERQYDEVLALVLKDPAMQQASDWRQMVPEAYRFMQRYAPTLAQDPAMARAFCRSVAGSSGVDLLNYRVASELAAAEKMYHEAGTSGGPMRDIEFFLRHPLTKAVSGGGGGGGGGGKK